MQRYSNSIDNPMSPHEDPEGEFIEHEEFRALLIRSGMKLLKCNGCSREMLGVIDHRINCCDCAGDPVLGLEWPEKPDEKRIPKPHWVGS